MHRRIVFAVTVLCHFCLSQALVATAQVATSQVENPFGGYDNPFGDDSSLTGDDEKRAREKDRIVRRVESYATHFGDHHEVSARWLTGKAGNLDDVLTVLQTLDGNYRRTSPVFVARDLAERRWRKFRKGETLPDYVINSGKPVAFQCLIVERNAADFAGDYKAIAGHYATFDWRSRKAFWLDYISTFISPAGKSTLAQTWKKKIDAAGQRDKRLMRLSYLGAAAANGERLDFSLLDSLYKDESADAQRLGDMVAILCCATHVGEGLKDPALDAIYEMLLKQIAEHPSQLTLYANSKWFTDGLRTIEIYGASPEDPRPSVLQTTVQHVPPVIFQEIASTGRFEQQEVHSFYLKKQTAINVENQPAKDVVSDLLKQVRIPLWLDQHLAASQQRITLKARGTWFNVFSTVLRAVGAEIVWLDETVFWAGEPKQLGVARKILAAATSKLTSPRCKDGKFQNLNKASFSNATVESILTHLDQYNLLSVCTATDFKKKASDIPVGLPVFLTLELLAREIEADWLGSEDWLIFGTHKQVKMLRRLIEMQKLRELTSSRLRLDILYEDARCSFEKTPLRDVAEYFGDLSACTFICATSHGGSVLSGNFWGIELELVLHAMLKPQNLGFVASEELVFIGSAEQLTRFKQLNKSRGKRQRQLPAVFRKKLKHFDLQGDLKQVLQRTNKVSDDAAFEIVGKSLQTRKVSMGVCSLDLCTLLDLLAVDTGSTWDYQDGAVTFTALLQPAFDKK